MRALFRGVVMMNAMSRDVPHEGTQYLNENPESMDRGRTIITRSSTISMMRMLGASDASAILNDCPQPIALIPPYLEGMAGVHIFHICIHMVIAVHGSFSPEDKISSYPLICSYEHMKTSWMGNQI